MSKKLTPTIARALAEKVRAELVIRNKDISGGIKAKIEASKEYKQILKLNTERQEIAQKIDSLKTALQEKHSTKVVDVSISIYNSDPKPNIYIREQATASVEGIKDMILIEDYMSENPLSSEEFIALIVDKLSNS